MKLLSFNDFLNYKLNEATKNSFDYSKLDNIVYYINDNYPDINSGGCAVFAKAFHNVTGFPYMLIFDSGLSEQDPPIHVMVMLPNNRLFDGEGIKTKQEIRNYFKYETEGKIIFVTDIDGSILENYYEQLGEGLFSTNHKEEFEDIKNIIKSNINLVVKESIDSDLKYLYHSTDTDSLFSILLQNCLAGSTLQEIDDKMVHGVSTTSDSSFIYKNYPITLVLNYSKLAERYKIIDLNFFETEKGKQKVNDFNLEIVDEKEKFIITKNITNITKYISFIRINNKKIIISPDLKELIGGSGLKVKDYTGKDITKKYNSNIGGISSDFSDFNSGGFDMY